MIDTIFFWVLAVLAVLFAMLVVGQIELLRADTERRLVYQRLFFDEDYSQIAERCFLIENRVKKLEAANTLFC